MESIPFVDLRAQYLSIKSEIDEALSGVLDKTAFIHGFAAKKFEDEFAGYLGAKHCVGVANGTDAIYLALRAVDVGPGDEVITCTHTFLATAEAISLTGAVPVFVDCDPATYNLDVRQLDDAITDQTKAIIPVHIYGQSADMDPILETARKHGLFVIEDAAQAQGARYKGKRIGALGDAATFSFYPSKNLGAFGDAGAVATNSDEIAEKIRVCSNHGRSGGHNEHVIEGINSRLGGFQGAVLEVKLRYLDRWNDLRRRNAAMYRERLADLPVELPKAADNIEHVYHVFAIQLDERDKLAAHLKAGGIACGIHYTAPVHLLPAYKYLDIPAGSFPVSERACRRLLSLPMFPELTESRIDRVCNAIRDFVAA